MFARLHFVFFVFVPSSLLDVLICVSFRFLYISLPHCVLYCLHDLKTVKPKKHHIFCAAGSTPPFFGGSQFRLKFLAETPLAWRIKQAAQTWALPLATGDSEILRLTI